MSNKKLEVVVSHTDEIDEEDAVNELISKSEAKLGNKLPDACILFTGIDYDHKELLSRILKKWPELLLIGGTTTGEMSSDLGFAEDSAVMILFKSNSVEFSAGLGDYSNIELTEACELAVNNATKNLKSEPRLCFTTPGNISTNIDQIIRNLNSELDDTLVFGGVPGDQWRFKEQYQFFGNKVFTNSIPILLLSGDISFSYGVDSGWEQFGETGVVTRSEGTVVYSINDSSALDFYKRGIGELTTPSSEFPIVILDENDNKLYQRTASEVLDTETGAVSFLGEVPEGSKVKLARSTRDFILDGAKSSIGNALENFPRDKEIRGCIFVSCAARKALLGTRTQEEMHVAKELIGSDIPMAGFYSYGEICPINFGTGSSFLHNQTFVTVLFGG